ncbi:methyltransferase domain-containing protein [Pararoseomonas sp. SCSIO 73927]|uniref:class I SAM-dependent methyltransferase n=1 Tax=Pararoseomonas sp. SCSIO 73927 TaxID=3114537 RepID=UPI0030D0882C
MDSYATWHADPAREPAMEESHRPLWRHFIETVPETDLSTRDVLDFGCNRGGFLRLLHALKPFRAGVGIDIAEDSIRAARAMAGPAPLEFAVATDLSPWRGRFDLAFSYEVIYLLPDLGAHAAAIHAALRPGGTYYAVTGCHNEGPLWPALREQIGRTTNAPVQDRSPDDYAAAFLAAGFDVSVRRFGFDGFTPASKDRRYFPRLTDALDYYTRDKLLFRMVRQDRPAP